MKIKLKIWPPWPSRKPGKARVAEARAQAAQSKESIAEAEHITRELRRMVADNHFAELIHNAITGRRPQPAKPNATRKTAPGN